MRLLWLAILDLWKRPFPPMLLEEHCFRLRVLASVKRPARRKRKLFLRFWLNIPSGYSFLFSFCFHDNSWDNFLFWDICEKTLTVSCFCKDFVSSSSTSCSMLSILYLTKLHCWFPFWFLFLPDDPCFVASLLFIAHFRHRGIIVV